MSLYHRRTTLDTPMLSRVASRSGGLGSTQSPSKRRGAGAGPTKRCVAVVFLTLAACCVGLAFVGRPQGGAAGSPFAQYFLDRSRGSAGGDSGPVLISYSYFEKDPIQRENFEFFLTVGMGLGAKSPQLAPLADTDLVVVVNGKVCHPCGRLYPLMRETEPELADLSYAYAGAGVALLKRSANEGMDFAAHNSTLSWLQARGQLGKYKYVIFLNSSIRGPFVPSYMPPGWAWTRAYTDRLMGEVKAVASSLVCLPEVDAGGFGPKLESWAFAVDRAGLGVLLEESVFQLRTCKLCKDGVVVRGEYGLTEAMMRHGYNIDTLMSKYGQRVDWRDRRHWRCNNNVHPSRHGTYDGLAMHPFETVFLKASWHVGEPFVDTYSRWMLAQAAGEDTTEGSFDEAMYRYAISPGAQESHNVGQCYSVLQAQS